MKKFMTLLAGYAAGMAVAMKYRKNAGTSKLDNTDPNKSKLDIFIDEVVDIHKTAFADIKNAVTVTFEEVDDFDSLKAKVATLIDDFGVELDTTIAELKVQGGTKKEELLAFADKAYNDREAMLEQAKTKALSFADVAHDTLDSWFMDSRKKLNTSYKKMRTRIEKEIQAKSSSEA